MNILEYENYHETKTHVDSTFPYNTYLCSIPLDFPNVPTHWHDEVEFIVIKKGQGIVAVDLEAHRVKAGDMVIIVPGQLHSVEQDLSFAMEYENILFQPGLLMSPYHDLCTVEYFTPFLSRKILFPTWIDEHCGYYKELIKCIDSIDTVCSDRPSAYQFAVKGYLYQFFYLLFGHMESVKRDAKLYKYLDKMKVVIKRIETDYGDSITIKQMAEVTGFSQSHFMKFFKSNMGISFVEYLNEYRLTMASRLLLVSSTDILTIAMDTGFSNVSYFNRLFKKKFGMTPSLYREAKVSGDGESREL